MPILSGYVIVQRLFRESSHESQNDDGYFVFRYLLIDIPSMPLFWSLSTNANASFLDSEARNPVRVFVERAPGVRENEPIMRFTSA